jgi:hypothetical protein
MSASPARNRLSSSVRFRLRQGCGGQRALTVRVLRGDGAGLAEEREDGRDQRTRRRPEDGWCVSDGGGRGWHLRGSVRVGMLGIASNFRRFRFRFFNWI